MTTQLNSKSLNVKSQSSNSSVKEMTLSEAETYLRKVGEWHGVVCMPRDTIIKWAMFLKNRETPALQKETKKKN